MNPPSLRVLKKIPSLEGKTQQFFANDMGFMSDSFYIKKRIMKSFFIIAILASNLCLLTAGNCGRCGWALNEKGKCPNPNCSQYGPSKD